MLKIVTIYLISVFCCYFALKLFRYKTGDIDFWTSHPAWVYDALIMFPILNIIITVLIVKAVVNKWIKKLFKIKK